jgi:hypothetical protein
MSCTESLANQGIILAHPGNGIPQFFGLLSRSPIAS